MDYQWITTSSFEFQTPPLASQQHLQIMRGFCVKRVEANNLTKHILGSGQILAFLQKHVAEQNPRPLGLRQTCNQGLHYSPRLREFLPVLMSSGAQNAGLHVAAGLPIQLL